MVFAYNKNKVLKMTIFIKIRKLKSFSILTILFVRKDLPIFYGMDQFKLS